MGLDVDVDVLPIYIGDDRTDEDAFRALRSRTKGGLGILVSSKVPSLLPGCLGRVAGPDELATFYVLAPTTEASLTACWHAECGVLDGMPSCEPQR